METYFERIIIICIITAHIAFLVNKVATKKNKKIISYVRIIFMSLSFCDFFLGLVAFADNKFEVMHIQIPLMHYMHWP
jgi:hypothetical protein